MHSNIEMTGTNNRFSTLLPRHSTSASESRMDFSNERTRCFIIFVRWLFTVSQYKNAIQFFINRIAFVLVI